MRARAAIIILTTVAVAGCALDAITLPIRGSVVVIHGLLSTGSSAQVVLIERTLTGAVPVSRVFLGEGLLPANSVSSREPILSDGGDPVRDAIVELELPDGSVIVAPEWTVTTPLNWGAGVYEFTLPGSSLVPGAPYRLRIRTTAGEEIAAQTIIPTSGGPPVAPPPATFDRESDTLQLAWSAAPGARAYEVRIESPYGAWTGITEATSIALLGSLRDAAGERLNRVLIPGFRQGVTVSAVDTNLYEYYRTVNDGDVGAGIVNRVTGGLGVFGAHAPLVRRTYDVVAPTVAPIEGTFDLIANQYGDFYGGAANAITITLYIESPGTEGRADVITASFARAFGGPGAAVGRLAAGQLTLRYLAGQTMADTVETMTAVLRGDTIVGTFSKGAPVRYVRRIP